MRFLSLVAFILIPLISFSQLSSLRVKSISTKADTVSLDTLSIAPSSLILMDNEKVVDTSAYQLDFNKSILTWNKKSHAYQKLSSDSTVAYFRVFPFSFVEIIRHKDINKISKTSGPGYNPFVYNPGESQASFFKYEGLNKSGSISRGITFGNNQDVFVNSSLNLQMAGRLNDNIN